MNDQLSATTIPFPPDGKAEFAETVERLAVSLTALSAALMEHRAGTRLWHASLRDFAERIHVVSAMPR